MAKRRLKKKVKYAFIGLISLIVIILLCVIISHNKKDKPKKEEPKKVVKEVKKEVNLTLVGDLMFEEPYLDSINNGDNVNNYLSLVYDKYFKNDDLTIGNLETTITDNNKLKVSGSNYTFCTPRNIIDSLDKASVNVLSTTNNHSTDRGLDGINSTLDYLNNNTKITPVGSFKNKEDRNKPIIIEKNGIKIGFVAYASGTNDFGKYLTEDEAWRLGLFRKLPYEEISSEYLETIKNEIKAVREKADIVIAIMHWGPEFKFDESDTQKKMAKFLSEQNVDIVLGSHSHCLQGIEWYTNNDHKTLVFYSFGNFTSADEDVERGNNDVDNAYQVGLLSSIKIKKEDTNITYASIKTEPVVNYFNKDKNDFKIVPLSEYSEEYEKNHYRYDKGLTKEYINNLYNKIISEEFRK